MKDGSSKFEYQALPADISRVAYNMNVGEFSEPFFMENSKGHQVCAVIRLKSKTEQHRASLEQDYQMMKAIVQEKKNQTTLENWIKKKQGETYTRISSDLKGCDWKYGNWNFSDK
jgi:peptidyl-prolyl cis-trans isomerase SurA